MMREDEPMWSRIKKKSRHRTGNRSDIMMRGAISHHYIPDLLAYLYEIQATGVLSVIHGKFKREIFVHQGVPTAVRSNLRMEQIGELLVAYKVMTRKELERTQETRKMSKQSFSAVAIQEGFLSQKDYFNYSRQLFLTIIARLYRLKEGDFRFEERELSREILAFRVSFPKLMAFGLRKITDDEQIRKMIGETTQVPYLTEHFSEDHEVVFTGPEQKVIKEIHSSRTIQDIISESRVEPHIVLQTLLILRYLKLIKMTVDFREEGLGEVIELNVSGDISPEFHKSLFDEPDVETDAAGQCFMLFPDSGSLGERQDATTEGDPPFKDSLPECPDGSVDTDGISKEAGESGKEDGSSILLNNVKPLSAVDQVDGDVDSEPKTKIVHVPSDSGFDEPNLSRKRTRRRKRRYTIPTEEVINEFFDQSSWPSSTSGVRDRAPRSKHGSSRRRRTSQSRERLYFEEGKKLQNKNFLILVASVVVFVVLGAVVIWDSGGNYLKLRLPTMALKKNLPVQNEPKRTSVKNSKLAISPKLPIQTAKTDQAKEGVVPVAVQKKEETERPQPGRPEPKSPEYIEVDMQDQAEKLKEPVVAAAHDEEPIPEEPSLPVDFAEIAVEKAEKIEASRPENLDEEILSLMQNKDESERLSAGRTNRTSPTPSEAQAKVQAVSKVEPSPPESDKVLESLINVLGVRHEVNGNVVRVVVETNGPVIYKKYKLPENKMVFISLRQTKLTGELNKKRFIVNSGNLKSFRFGQYKPETARVVLDLNEMKEVSVSSMTAPYRIVIDVVE